MVAVKQDAKGDKCAAFDWPFSIVLAEVGGLEKGGRGAGNCNLELLLNFLKNPKFNVEPIYKVIQEEFVPLRNETEWGFNDIYCISGHLNQHPRAAMKLRANKKNRDHCYDFLIEQSRLDEGIIS